MLFALPPAIIMILAGLALPLTKGYARTGLMLAAPAAILALIWTMPEATTVALPYLGHELTLLRIDPLAKLFGTIFAIMGIAGGLYASRQTSTLELSSAMIYMGASLGVVFAGDHITLFVFWEVMAVASTLVIFANGASARAAGMRYAMVHFFGGVLLMAGVAGEVFLNGSVSIEAMEANSWPRYLLLIGILINAGAPPFSSWIADAYPKASWSGTVFLSAFTTKTAIYVLMRTFPGTEILLVLGAIMILYGVIFALLENDIRRMLAYSIVSQVGFMVVAIGVGSDTALAGAAAHAFVHISYKALLLMGVGAILYHTGKSKFTRLGGLLTTMPITFSFIIVAALSMAALPGTSGFATKSLISYGVAKSQIEWVWFILTAASAGTFLYAGLKLPYFAFINKEQVTESKEAPISMIVSMAIMAVICIIFGIFPAAIYGMMPVEIKYQPYTIAHVLEQGQLLIFTTLTFVLFKALIEPKESLTLDIDWFYRRFGSILGRAWTTGTSQGWKVFSIAIISSSVKSLNKIQRLVGSDSTLAKTWPTGLMAFWTTTLLVLYVVIYALF